MARTRVSELARLLGVEASRVAEILGTLGVGEASADTEMTDDQARAVRAVFTREALIGHRRRQVTGRQSVTADGKAKPVRQARPAPPAPAPTAQKARSVITAESIRARQEAELAARAATERVVARPAPPPEPVPERREEVSGREAKPAAAERAAQRTEAPPAAGARAAEPPGPSRKPSERTARPGAVAGRRSAAQPKPAGDTARPARPATRRGRPGAPRPGARPSGPGSRPSGPGARPSRPGARPLRPGGRRPSRPPRRRRGGRAAGGAGSKRLAPAAPAKVAVEGPMTVRELAEQAGVPMAAAVKQLMMMGVMATVNETLDVDIAKKLAVELGAQLKETAGPEEAKDKEPGKAEAAERSSRFMRLRPPVVTVMGHVDHGKTTLLDAIRESQVAAHEAGGITQHIGASVVEWQGNNIVFIDTPGHEAFTAMRARGAQVTDLVILVVAADDGVKPQTVEAVNHIKAAKVPMIVAVNKIDRPGADPERIRRQLAELAVNPEEWGGDTVFVDVSALQGTGIDTLLEMVVLVSEMQELKANPLAAAKGTVVEAQLDRSRGPVATVLVQTGTLRVGDAVVAGTSSGRVRALFDHLGKRVDSAGPSVPVEVLGLSEVPTAGDQLEVTEDEKVARGRAARALERRKTEQAARPTVSLDDLYASIKTGEIKELNLVLKADVQGSLEALQTAVGGLDLPEVRPVIVHGGVGPISESDVMLASTSEAVIIGFSVRPDANARRAAQRENVQIRTYAIIYEITDDITAAAKGMLEPKMEKVLIGRAQVRALFKVPRVGTIAGCYVTDGRIVRGSEVRVLRDGQVLYEGDVDSLKRFKDDVREVQSGYECGIGVEGFEDFVEGDVIEAYTMQRREQAG